MAELFRGLSHQTHPGIILVKERHHTKFGSKFLNWSHQNSGVDPRPGNKKLSGHRCWVIGALKNNVVVDSEAVR